MNKVEELLTQAQSETRKMCQESYSEGFADAEGALHVMQRMFNDVQNVLLKALGRERRATEITLDTAEEVAAVLKSRSSWSWDWAQTPPALFGGSTNNTKTATGAMLNQKTVVFSEDINTPCTAALEVKLQALAVYFDRKARENTKRAEKLEKKANTFQQLGDCLQNERSSFYFSGKANSYERASEKVRELLG